MPTSEIAITPNGGFQAYYANALNTTNTTASLLFTDQDGSQWGCFAGTNGRGQVPGIFHITGSTVQVFDPGLAVWSGSDQHNACSLALDVNGFVWMCYDQHVSALNCYKSNSARNVSAMTKVSPLVNGTTEASSSFVTLFTNPATHALYLWFLPGGGFTNQLGYFYCYNAGTTTWAGCPGTATNGQVFSNATIGGGSSFTSGLPQWDKTTGYMWLNWQWSEATAPNWNCGDSGHGYPCGEYLLGWTGSGFIDIHGNAVTLPIQQATLAPVYTVRNAESPSFSIFDSFSIDANETAFMPYLDVDASGFLQVYVVSANLHTATVGTAIQLTSNNSAFTPPAPAGWLGVSMFSCTSAPYSCGEHVQSVTAVSSGTCTWVTYADIFNWGAGQAAYKSCNNFASSTFQYLTTRFNPNLVIYPDQVRNYTTGDISFLFQQSNDTQFRFATFISSQPNLYEIMWSPGGSTVNASARLSGAASIQ